MDASRSAEPGHCTLLQNIRTFLCWKDSSESWRLVLAGMWEWTGKCSFYFFGSFASIYSFHLLGFATILLLLFVCLYASISFDLLLCYFVTISLICHLTNYLELSLICVEFTVTAFRLLVIFCSSKKYWKSSIYILKINIPLHLLRQPAP